MNWQNKLQEITSDNINSATFITLSSISLLKEMAVNASLKDLQKALDILKNSHTMMATVYNLSIRAKEFLQKNPKEKLPKFCDEFEKYFIEANEKTALKAAKIIKDSFTILTYSYSSLVLKAILKAKEEKKRVKVICTESRPKNEGVMLAKKLKENNIETVLIIDALASSLVKKCDLILIGADGVSRDYLIHKAGTLPLALSAKYFNKKIYSLAPSLKFWPESFNLTNEPLKNPKEVSQEDLKILNLYFDKTPKELISKFIDEK